MLATQSGSTIRDQKTGDSSQEARLPNETVAQGVGISGIPCKQDNGRAIKSGSKGHRTRHKGTPSQREEDPSEGQET